MLSLGIPRTYGSSVQAQAEAFEECLQRVREAVCLVPLYSKFARFIGKYRSICISHTHIRILNAE